MTDLAKLFKQRQELSAKIVAASLVRFPPGARVEFIRGRGSVRARVLENHGNRLKILNTVSGLSYFVGLDWLVGGAK